MENLEAALPLSCGRMPELKLQASCEKWREAVLHVPSSPILRLAALTSLGDPMCPTLLSSPPCLHSAPGKRFERTSNIPLAPSFSAVGVPSLCLFIKNGA